MLIYFLKVVLLSGLFYSIYYFLLSREKSFKFNRFYLLGTLLLSYLIPFIKIPVEGQKRVVVGELVEVANFNQAAANINPTALTQSSSVDYLLIFYAIITLILVLKFVFNLYSILRIKGNLVVFKGIRLLKAHQKIPPFSFLNTMYLNKDDFKSLDDKIWIHEKCHIQQKHSIDILLIELFICFSWFNPMLFLFRKKVKANHEFLADEEVLKQFPKQISGYQHLILNESMSFKDLHLTHQFYNTIKNRFNMMNSTKKQKTWKLYLSISAVVGLVFVGSEKVYAAINSPTNETKQAMIQASQTSIISNSNNIVSEPIVEQISKNSKVETIDNQQPVSIQDTIKPQKNQSDNEIFDKVDELAKPILEDGFNGIRRKFQKEFNSEKLEGVEMLKTTVFFVIEKDGSVSDVKAEGNNQLFNDEAVKALLLANEGVKWRPGKLKNSDVRSRFKFPITMSFAPKEPAKK